MVGNAGKASSSVSTKTNGQIDTQTNAEAPDLSYLLDGLDPKQAKENTSPAETAMDEANNKPIRVEKGMSDEDRNNVLQTKSIVVPRYDSKKMRAIQSGDFNDLQNSKLTAAINILKRIGRQFGVFVDYKNADMDIQFNFSENKLQHSANKQKESFQEYAKLLSVLNEVAENAIGINVSDYRYEGNLSPNVDSVYVLLGAYETENGIVPVKLEVKQYNDGTKNKLDILVTSTPTNKKSGSQQDMTPDAGGNASNPAFSSEDGVGKKSQAGISRPVSKTASTNITLAELISFVNEKDGGLLKYIPDALLTGSQQKAKAQALVEQEKYGKARNEKYGNRKRFGYARKRKTMALFY